MTCQPGIFAQLLLSLGVCLTCGKEGFAQDTPSHLRAWVQQNASGDTLELEWESKTGERYTLLTSENLDNFAPVSDEVSATPPYNRWWVEIAERNRAFFVVQKEATALSSDQLVNGGFQAGSEGWTMFLNQSQASFVSENGAARIQIMAGGLYDYSVQFIQQPITLRKGKFYVFEFDAKAPEGNRSLLTRLQSHDNPVNLRYLTRTVELTDAFQTFRFTLQMNSETDTSARVAFNLGGDDGDVVLDNISVRKGYTLRSGAHAFNRRLGRGNNLAAELVVESQGAPEDAILLNYSGFNHARIGYTLENAIRWAPGDSIWPTAGWYGVGNVFKNNEGRGAPYGALAANAYYGANAGNTDPYDENENLIGRGSQLCIIEGNDFNNIGKGVWANSAMGYLLIRNNDFELNSEQALLEIPPGHEYPKTQIVLDQNALR